MLKITTFLGAILFVVSAIIRPVPAFAVEPGAAIFSDSFDTSATFAENWAASGGKIQSHNGKIDFQDGTLSLRQPLPEEFYIECDLTLYHDLNTPTGFAGMMIGDYRFQVRPEGAAFLLWREIGSEAASGYYPAIDGFKLGQPTRTAVSRTVEGDLACYAYYINGKRIKSFWGEAPDKSSNAKTDRLTFAKWNVDKIEIANFRLCAVKKSADESPNLIVNSSFEALQDGFPLYFCRGNTMIYAKTLQSGYEAYLNTVQVDERQKHSGRVSLKAVNNDLTAGQSFFFHGAGTVQGQSGVFSVWLKADRPDLEVRLQYGSPPKTVKVSTEWKRYETVNLNLPKPFVYSPVQIIVPAEQKGTLWIDDAQAELLPQKPTEAELASGKTFATPYKASELDKTKLADALAPRKSATFSLQEDKRLAAAVEKQTKESLSLLGRLSFYMNEPEAAFRVQVRLPDAAAFTAVLEGAGQTVQKQAAPAFLMTIPLTEVQPGDYEVKLKLLRENGEVAATAQTRLVKREFRPNASRINHFSRAIVVGDKPFFQFAPFVGDYSFTHVFQPEKAKDMFRIYDRYGFKSTHILFDPTRKESVLTAKAFMEEAAKADAKTMVWIASKPCPEDQYRSAIKEIGEKNVVSYQVLDEPELSTPEEKTIEFLNAHRPMFLYHPMHMNNTVIGIPRNYAHLDTDILMIDDYLTNSENRTLYSVVCFVDLMYALGAAEGKPCYYFVVGGNFPLHYREPAYREQIAQCYGLATAGCTGLSFFYGWPQTPGNWKACVQLAKEFAILNDALTSEEDCSAASATGNPRFMRVRAKKQAEYVYLIGCNIDSAAAGEVTMALPPEFGYDSEAEVLFEDRRVPVRDGRITDNFDDWTRHVYKIRTK